MLVSESYQRSTQTVKHCSGAQELAFLAVFFYTPAPNTRGQLSTVHWKPFLLQLWHLAVAKHKEIKKIWPSSRPNMACTKGWGRNTYGLGDLYCTSPSRANFWLPLSSSLVLQLSVCCLDWLQSQWMWQLLLGDLGLQRGQDVCLPVLVT